MKRKIFILGTVLTLIMSLFLISACSEAAAEPTIDPNVIYTEAAKTVAAQLTESAPATATASPTAPPTNTPVPATATATAEPATQTPEVTEAIATNTSIPPTPTMKSNADDLIDEALFTVYYPPVDQIYTSGGTFNAQVGFQNVGPNTWNNGYSMRFLSGNSFGVPGKYTLDEYGSEKDVAPGEEVIITIPGMVAPTEEGRYISNWCFYNNREDQGLPPQCFFLVTFQIIVQND